MNERAAEATRDPIWMVEARDFWLHPNSDWAWCGECEGYYRADQGSHCAAHSPVSSPSEAFAADSEGFCRFWRPSGDAFLSREKAEAWAKRREHHYPDGWRVFCYALPKESALTPLLLGLLCRELKAEVIRLRGINRRLTSAGSPWEELDTTNPGVGGYNTFYAVLDCEGTSPQPLGIFPDKDEAERWAKERLAAAKADGFEEIYFSEYWAALPVRGLGGEFWNSHDPVNPEDLGWK